MTFNDLSHLVRLYFDVSCHFAVIVIYIHNWFQITGTDAACDINFDVKAFRCDLFFQFCGSFLGTGRDTAAALSNYYFHAGTSYALSLISARICFTLSLVRLP